MTWFLSSPFGRKFTGIACLALGTAIAVLSAAPASAGDFGLELRKEIKVYSGLVLLGDLFENAGPAASAPVFRSPDLGTQGVVSTKRIASAARQHGLYWTNPRDIAQVTVKRPGRLVTLEEINDAIGKYAARNMGLAGTSDLTVTFDERSSSFHVDPRITGPLVVKRFTGGARSRRFHAVVTFDDPHRGTGDHTYKGQVYETMAVVVPARPIKRGATIGPGDVELIRMPKAKMKPGLVMDTDQLTGMAAKRTLAAGQPVRRNDLERPKLVRRNALVTLSYEIPGLELKSQGRAQADAAMGETVPVLNTRSNQTIQATVRGPGLVVVEAPHSGKNHQPVLAENRAGALAPHSVR